jgi:NeuB family
MSPIFPMVGDMIDDAWRLTMRSLSPDLAIHVTSPNVTCRQTSLALSPECAIPSDNPRVLCRPGARRVSLHLPILVAAVHDACRLVLQSLLRLPRGTSRHVRRCLRLSSSAVRALSATACPTYPCPVDQLNLRMMDTLKRRWPNVPIGYSGSSKTRCQSGLSGTDSSTAGKQGIDLVGDTFEGIALDR